MQLKLIYPKWEKLPGQTTFDLPPHGPVVFAAALPKRVEVTFVDENVEELALDDEPEAVAISMMLTAQARRGFAIADSYRARGIPVIAGGIATMLHAEETLEHVDAVFLGEAEGRMEEVIADLERRSLERVYNYLATPADLELVGPARRDLLDTDRYYHKGVRMVDLFHASRGCRFSCYPCAVSYLGGRTFRPRPMHRVREELERIDNRRLFVVDNSLAQDREWLKDLFRTMEPYQKTWCSHPIKDDPEILELAARAGAWYVYQAVFDTSDFIRDRIRRYHDHGIAVEGTILLGLDDQSEDDIKRLVEFLCTIELDLAEFTVLTPFPHTKAYDDLDRQGRILHRDWNQYDAGHVVYQPRQMSPERLAELYDWAWQEFYRDESQSIKMFKLLKRAVEREQALGTFVPRRRDLARRSFGVDLDAARGGTPTRSPS
ncbi:MAG: B12-binding domain-containing radical SAM protein [Polyangiaceae bacterium]|nr:B12-binding domain-containing radical SAM protein [Polyangiaceae bacterium]